MKAFIVVAFLIASFSSFAQSNRVTFPDFPVEIPLVDTSYLSQKLTEIEVAYGFVCNRFVSGVNISGKGLISKGKYKVFFNCGDQNAVKISFLYEDSSTILTGGVSEYSISKIRIKIPSQEAVYFEK
ncbi:MAG TPA: hypothetical protein VNJ01_17320 [Bacteriovoracaceae bacterium]|nr:hypothetical protein [Bacteriovoracaceae bacterium]